ncbi:hypothetical protein KIPB_001100 [Kipferlia bialata]|uniref:Kelch-type beta propeller n=1 Tax=Kipferlia bialata TaxID=797122 RepID=A0A391NUC4_9EUKA|nr:hypothetical protein KIPB_001100 [Kipferlia bialata]|eukprot:g1100.t1
MDLEDWYTACTEIPRVVQGGAISHLSMATLGDNGAMLVYREDDDDEDAYPDSAEERWLILSLTHNGEVERETIPGPPNPGGVVGMQLARVGDVVVAYGGGEWDMYEEWYKPHWFMAAYTIATGDWETIPYTKGPSIGMPHVFSTGDALVVVGGYEDDMVYDTWEWSLESRVWAQSGRCPTEVFSGNVGVLLGSTYYLYTGACLLSYTNQRWQRLHDVDRYGAILAAPLYGNHMLVLTCQIDSIMVQESDLHYWIFDSVSQDMIPPPPLPLSDEQSASLQFCSGIFLNPTTILIVTHKAAMLVDVDPFVLGPEYHTVRSEE